MSRTYGQENSLSLNNLLNAMIILAITSCGFLVTGCGDPGLSADPQVSVQLRGVVRNGSQAIVGADVQLYITGMKDENPFSTALLKHPVKSDRDGSFMLSEMVACPLNAGEAYLVATGGQPAETPASSASLVLMSGLGACNRLTKLSVLTVNEVTTVGSIWPLARYARSYKEIGPWFGTDQEFLTAIERIPALINVETGQASASGPSASEGKMHAELNMLARTLSECILSTV